MNDRMYAVPLAAVLALLVAGCNGSGASPTRLQGPAVFANLGELEDAIAAASSSPNPAERRDIDGDGIPDSVEVRLGTEPALRDTDRDGLDDRYELFGDAFERADPLPDRDGDGHIAPMDSDENGDGRNDGETTDTDGDGIPNKLELEGYTYDLVRGEFVPWNGDPAVPHYVTDPLQVSTDQDAFSDGTEASGVLLDPSVREPGTDPLVPAYPNIVVELKGYTVTLNEDIQISQGESLERGREWTRTTEESYTRTDESAWQLGAETALSAEPGVTVSANYGETYSNAHTSTTSVSVGESVTSSENWSIARSFNPSDAARIKLFFKVHNRGTAPLSNLVPTITLKVGGLNVVTFEPGSAQVHMLVPGATYPAEAGVFWTVETVEGGGPLSLTMAELRALERGAPVSIAVTQVRGDVMRLTPEATWERIGDTNEYVARCDAVCANLRIDLGDGQVLHQLIYADDAPSAPVMLLGDALRRMGVQDGILHYADRTGVPRTRSLSRFNFAFDDDTLRANGWTLAGDGAAETAPPPGFVLEETRLLPDSTLVVRAPRDPQAAPGPVIHFAYLDPFTGEVKVSAADYQGISSVVVVNDDASATLTLAEEIPGSGFYAGQVDAEGTLSVQVTNLGGTVAEAVLGSLYVEPEPQAPLIHEVTMDLPNLSLYANVSSGNPADPASDILWVRAFHPLLGTDGAADLHRVVNYFEDPDGYSLRLPPGFQGQDVEVVAFVAEGVYSRQVAQVVQAHRSGTTVLTAYADQAGNAALAGAKIKWCVPSLNLDSGTRLTPCVEGLTWKDADNPPSSYEFWTRVDVPAKNSEAYLRFHSDYARLGGDFNALTRADIENANPSSRASLRIGASGGTGLREGDILGIRTTGNLLAKVQVTAISSSWDGWALKKTVSVTVRYVTFKNP